MRGATFLTLALVLIPGTALAQTTVQSYSLLDFAVVDPAVSRHVDLDFFTLAVNLEGADCCLVKGAVPPAAATLLWFELDACDSSTTGSANLSVLLCTDPGEGCVFIGATSTGTAEAPGCTTAYGRVMREVDPSRQRVVLLHSDTDLTEATTAAAVRLYWAEGSLQRSSGGSAERAPMSGGGEPSGTGRQR